MTPSEYGKQWRSLNQERIRAGKQAYYRANHEAINKKNREYRRRKRAENPTLAQTQNLKYEYGLTLAEFERLHEDQAGRCAICMEQKKLFVDHDHLTGKLRGLLCRECNLGLGFFQDSIGHLGVAINYLENHVR